MALVTDGLQPAVLVTNTTPVTVGVTSAVDIPPAASPVAGYRITWTVSGGTDDDVFSISVGRPDGTGIDLGDGVNSDTVGVYVRGPISDVTFTPDFVALSTKSVTFFVQQVDQVPEMHTVTKRTTIVTATATPVVITLPTGTQSDLHQYTFSLVGTWTAGNVTPTETEPGGYVTSFGAQAADYRCARRVGPVSNFEMAHTLTSVGVLFVSTHRVPVV